MVLLATSFTTGNCCSSFLSTADGTATPAYVREHVDGVWIVGIVLKIFCTLKLAQSRILFTDGVTVQEVDT